MRAICTPEAAVVRISIEKTFLTTAEGMRVIQPHAQHFVVDEPTLREALLQIIKKDDGRMMGTITEIENRAVCTGWTAGKLYVLVAESAGD